MKKIMFNDVFYLTQAVLDGTKTMTRRKFTLTLDKKVDGKLIRVYPSKVFFDNGKWLFEYEGRIYNLPKENYPRYGVGEVVAIAQSYESIMDESVRNSALPCWNFADDHCDEAGWNNKMFVRADLMKHRIRIIDVKVERLQDISDEDCLCEGIEEHFNGIQYVLKTNAGYCYQHPFDTPREAFASLIDKVSGKGTWESNPWVVAYSFELVD